MRKFIRALFLALLGTAIAMPVAADVKFQGHAYPFASQGHLVADPVTGRVFGTGLGTGFYEPAVSSPPSGGWQIPVRLESLVHDPFGNKFYGAVYQEASLAIIDGVTLAVTKIPLAANGGRLALNPVTRKVYVTIPTAGSVAVVDMSTLAVTPVAVVANPGHVTVNYVTNRIYVGSTSGAGLTLIDGATLATTPIAITENVTALAVNPMTNVIYALVGDASPKLYSVSGTTHSLNSIVLVGNPRTLLVDVEANKVYIGTAAFFSGSTGFASIVDGTTLAKTDGPTFGQYCCEGTLNTTTDLAFIAASGFASNYSPPSGPTVTIDKTGAFVNQGGVGANSLAANAFNGRTYQTNSYLGGNGIGSYSIGTWVPTPAAGLQTVPVGTTPTAIATNVATAKGYVVNSGDNTVTVVDEATLGVTTVPVGLTPVAVAINPITNRAYVANEAGGSVTVIDGANATTTVTVGTQPRAIAVNTHDDKIYVMNAGSNNLSVIDGATGLVAPPVALGVNPKAMAFDSRAGRIYVANNDGTVSIVDATTLAVTTITAGANPIGIDIDPDLSKVYVLNAAGTVTIITTPANTTVTGTVGTNPSAILVDPDTHRVYITRNATVQVTVLNGVTLGTSTIEVGDSPTSMSLDRARRLLYFGYRDGVKMYNAADQNNVVVAATAAVPLRAASNPATGAVYITNTVSGQVQVQQASGINLEGIPTAITPLPGHRTAAPTPTFVFQATPDVLPVAGVFFQVDSTTGTWSRATPAAGGTWTGTVASALSPGTHILYAIAADAFLATPNAPVAGKLTRYVFTVGNECATVACANLSVTQSSVTAQGEVGKDIVLRLVASNAGPAAATGATITEPLPAGSTFIWASPGCVHATGTVTCTLGNVASGASSTHYMVYRMAAAGTAVSTATIASTTFDPEPTNNAAIASVPVTTPPPGVAVLRYRLYSPVTLEHHFTTDLNEYNVLGAQTGTWTQEGTVGQVLNNPGSFNGVEAVPYYRLYDGVTRWHHWTTDPNEYYTLALVPTWYAEGVDGWILPTATAGATELFRLNYPHNPGLHHWTIDPVEYNQLITNFGWVGEPGAGFVIQ